MGTLDQEVLVPLPVNSLNSDRVKAPQIDDRKLASIKPIQASLRSSICGSFDAGPSVRNLREAALELTRAIRILAAEEDPLFASPEDCNYFRSLYRALPSPPPKPATIAAPAPLGKTASPISQNKPELPKEIKEEKPPTPLPSLIPLPEKKALPQVSDSFDDLRHLFSKIAAGIRIIDEIPSDAPAKQISERWKTRNQAAPISLLVYQEPPEHFRLLENLAIALNIIFGNAHVIQCAQIEKEKQWEAFLSAPEIKYVIVCDAALWQLPNLLQFYREVPSHSERFLHKTPVFLLPDLSLYLKDPLLKRSLWKALCQKIA